MKKLISLLLILALLPICAFSEIDLSSLSFEDLAALRDQCLLEMFSRDEWQEVTVPQGLYEIGVHIPAGTWTIRCSDKGWDSLMMGEADLRWGVGKPDGNGYWSYKTEKGDVDVYCPNNTHYRDQVTEVTITLEEGWFLYIEPAYNSVVFTPPVGPSFSFK